MPSACNSIVFLRKLHKKESEDLLQNNVPIISTVYVKVGSHADYSYNTTLLKHKHKRDGQLNVGLSSLVPANKLKTYFMTSDDWNKVEKLPTILRKFERFVICQHLIIENKISSDKWTTDNFNKFIQATTHPDICDGNDYEKLETLGK